mmetsp:Transcript_10557/g.22413  ORF Transcript_10557/g.22413 Transcript_10557/m.22413 type:complete len:427 (+) Transcript_10557:321-1601(+)
MTMPSPSRSPPWPTAHAPGGASSPTGALTGGVTPTSGGSLSPSEITTSPSATPGARAPAPTGPLRKLASSAGASSVWISPSIPSDVAPIDTGRAGPRLPSAALCSSPAIPHSVPPRDGDRLGQPISGSVWSTSVCLRLCCLDASRRTVASVPTRTNSANAFTLTRARCSSAVARAATLNWSYCPCTTANASPAPKPASTLATGVSFATCTAILTPILTLPQCLRAAVPTVLSIPSREQRSSRCGRISRSSKLCLRAQPLPVCLYSLLRSNSCATKGQSSGGWYLSHSLNCLTAVGFTKMLKVTCQTRMGLSPWLRPCSNASQPCKVSLNVTQPLLSTRSTMPSGGVTWARSPKTNPSQSVSWASVQFGDVRISTSPMLDINWTGPKAPRNVDFQCTSTTPAASTSALSSSSASSSDRSTHCFSDAA